MRRAEPAQVFFKVGVANVVGVCRELVVARDERIGAKSDFPIIREAILVGIQRRRRGQDMLPGAAGVVDVLDFSGGQGAAIQGNLVNVAVEWKPEET